MSQESGPFEDYKEYKMYDDVPVVDEDVLVEQDNEFVADRWIEAEDYEWET